jgi:hypothetical protein
MRKILLAIALFFGFVGPVFAQVDITDQIKIHRNVTTDTGSSEAAADLLRVIQHYNAIAPNPYDFRGNPVHIRLNYGGDLPAVGTAGGLAIQSHIYHSGNNRNEWNTLFLDFSDDAPENGGRVWQVDASVFGPVFTQANLLQGPVWFMGNYNPSPVENGSFGMSVVSLPGAGGGDVATDRFGRQTYPIDIGFAVSGWSGTRDQSINTPAYKNGIQIGGWASGWMSKYMRSTMGNGLRLADDYTGNGIDMADAHITGSPIKFPANYAGSGDHILCVDNDGKIFMGVSATSCR